MKLIRIVTAGIIGAALVGGVAVASPEGEGHEQRSDKREMYMKMAQERHEMSQDMMKMLRETMEIVRNLDHKASAGEKEKLGKMIGRIDEMLQKHEDMREEHKQMHDEKKMMRDEKMEMKGDGKMMHHPM